MTKNILPEDAWDALVDGIIEGKYHILLGAGFSKGVTSRNGQELPLGKQLAQELSAAFSVPVEVDADPPTLASVASVARKMKSTSGEDYETWMHRRFHKVNPPSWMRSLKRLPPQTFWTFNIDDALERAFGDDLVVANYDDKPHGRLGNRHLLVHLHGSARNPKKTIFTLAEYSGNIAQNRVFYQTFNINLSSGPTLAIGATMANDVDIATALAKRSQLDSSRFPSIIVNPSPSKLELLQYEQWGFTAARATGEEFTLSLVERVESALLKYSLATNKKGTDGAVRFARNWRELSPSSGSNSRTHRDFLAGSEPTMADVTNQLMITREGMEEFENMIVKGGNVLLHGSPFCGKSSFALATLAHLLSGGWEVVQFLGDERIDTSSALERLRARPQTIFYFDDAGLFENDIRELIDALSPEDGDAQRIVCVDRSMPASRILRRSDFAVQAMRPRLTDKEKSNLIQLLDSNDKLNEKYRSTPWKKKPRNAPPDRDFLSLVSELVGGTNLRERVLHDVENLSRLEAKLYFAASVLARPSRGVRISIAASLLGISGSELDDLIDADSPLARIANVEGNRIVPTNRRHGEIFVGHLSDKRLALEAITDTALALGQVLNLDAIRNRTPDYRAAAVVLDEENVSRWAGSTNVERFYADIEDVYSWNSRYWEQRALAASSRQNFDDAFTFAHRALSAHDDAFVHNTTAVVWFRQSLTRRTVDDWLKDYGEAYAEIRTALKGARDDSEYPYVTYFHHTHAGVKMARQSGWRVPDELYTTWRKMMADAEHSRAFADPLGQQKLQSFGNDWMKLVSS